MENRAGVLNDLPFAEDLNTLVFLPPPEKQTNVRRKTYGVSREGGGVKGEAAFVRGRGHNPKRCFKRTIKP